MRGLKIGQILREKQPEMYQELNKTHKKERKAKKENLSFSDIERMMMHDGYCRHNGAIKQVRHR